jgi:hypothetical protein
MNTTKLKQLNNEDWLRQWTIPEEDRRKHTSLPWTGGYRWFRSANVIPIEQWRKKWDSQAATPAPKSG